MGVSCLGSSSSYDAPSQPVPSGNPDPCNWILLRSHYNKGVRNEHVLLVEVEYPDAKNCEGRKIMLYKGMTLERLKTISCLDPHFSKDHPELSPVARFIPNDNGWDMGMVFITLASGL